MSRRLVKAARELANGHRAHGDGITTLQVEVKSGWAVGRRSAVAHIVQAAETLSADGEAVMVAWWACGGQTVDAVPLADPTEYPQCISCSLSLIIPAGPVVYRCYDESGALLYIGSSINMVARTRTHMGATHWWKDVASVTYETHETELDARRAESRAIASEPSVHNRQGTLRDRRIGGVL